MLFVNARYCVAIGASDAVQLASVIGSLKIAVDLAQNR